MVVLKEKEALPSGERSGQSLFSFKKARLYKNIKSCQLVLACPISEEQIEDVKKMSYIYKPSNPLMIIEGDYVIMVGEYTPASKRIWFCPPLKGIETPSE